MRLAFLGAGRMGGAFLEALLHAGVSTPDQCIAADPLSERQLALQQQLGVRTTPDNREASQSADVLFLAVKPQQLQAVLQEIAPTVEQQNPLVISIAAGKRLAFLERYLPNARIIRVMPNVCCLIGEGMNVFTPGTLATPHDRATAQRLLSACGKTLELPEPLFDAVTALSGSGPAFFARFLLALTEAAVAEGLSEADARRLAVQTMLGTARMLAGPQPDPKMLIAMVASPQGTTAEGLKTLDQSDFDALVRRMVAAAARRSRELSEG